jgi:hypothetical protein
MIRISHCSVLVQQSRRKLNSTVNTVLIKGVDIETAKVINAVADMYNGQ